MNTTTIKADPRSVSEQRAAAKPNIKPEVLAALDPASRTILVEALDQLCQQRLDSLARWRVLQLEHALCVKEPETKLEEP